MTTLIPGEDKSMSLSAQSILQAAANPIVVLDLSGRVVFSNHRARVVCEAEAGVVWTSLWNSKLGLEWTSLLDNAQGGIPGEIDFAHCSRGNEIGWWRASVLPIRHGDQSVSGLLVSMHDITEFANAVQRARTSATTDALTGLPNRAFFVEYLENSISEAQVSGEKVWVVLLDLDHFKEINDDLGHDAGDVLLRGVAQKLTKLPDPVRLAARLGGDEFVLVLRGRAETVDPEAIVRPLIEQLISPITYEGRRLTSKASFGISVAPDHGATCRELLKSADLALYMAKDLGRGGYAFFDPLMQAAVRARNQTAERVRHSLNENIEAYYQPKIRLDTGALDGLEALLRIRSSSGAMEGPAAIASAFDNVDLSCRISDRMFDIIISDMRRFLDAGLAFGRVAVNAAAPELRRYNFAREVLQRLERAGIPPRMLELEVVEGVFLGRGAGAVDDNLRLLRKAGVTVALDDFGTGYASLAHIRNYAVDCLKIDMSFVQGIGNPKDEAIISAIGSLGRSLGLNVVAEGIEEAYQARFLRNVNCPIGQGFLFSKPLALTDLMRYFSQQDLRMYPWMHRGCCDGPAEGGLGNVSDVAVMHSPLRQ